MSEALLGQVLFVLLSGSVFANAIRAGGKPCRIALPDEPKARLALIDAHARGAPASLTFHADGCAPWCEDVQSVVLAAFCPAVDGRCRWLGIDLDATDHGDCGLADPVHAMRTLAERADAAGLADGLLAARSRRSRGRHLFLLLPKPVPLSDAVIGVAALAAAAFKIAAADTTDHSVPHAFRRASGAIARPGDAGAVELIPRSTQKPPYGWALALPAAGAFRAAGGGIIVDPFTDQPTQPDRVPVADCAAWWRFVAEARAAYAAVKSRRTPARGRPDRERTSTRGAIDRMDRRAREFIDGQVPQGSRNAAAFAASANLLGCGVDPLEAERLLLAGAAACGLPDREARSAFKSAVAARARRPH